MKNLTFLTAFLCVYILNAQDDSFIADKIWETTDLLTTSESVCYDPGEKVLYVACINGNPVEKDGNGFISKVSLNGDIILLKWAEGLNAPKGMGITRGKLYVTDIDRVVKIDLKSGKKDKEFPVEEAKFLNDITVDPEGNIYITDMARNHIYRIHKDAIGLWIKDDRFENPNGLNFERGEVLLGTKNGIYSIDAESREVWHMIRETGGIDGLEIYGNGYYIISDWSGKVQVVHRDKEPQVLFNTSEKGINAADIHYVSEMEQLFVPTFMDNRVTAYSISFNK